VSRQGLLIHHPYERMGHKEIENIHDASMDILNDPGLICFNEEAAGIFSDNGADVQPIPGLTPPGWKVRIPVTLVNRALESAPKTVTLGARNPDNALVMNGDESRVYFISGSECNIWLDPSFETYVSKNDSAREIRVPSFHARRGTVNDLCNSARVFEQLDTVDGIIRNVNIQDDDITEDNKDVNKYFACLNNSTKHVMAGLTKSDQLDNVITMAEIIAGGETSLRGNPIISFITCLVKSPLQFVDDTTATYLKIVRRGMPVVVSSSPQAGTTAPPSEAGMLAQINAEVLAGITLGQLVNPGTPVLYGTVPVRARMDTLDDSYGAVETTQYNIDCSQLARHYHLPNYSTAGVSDAKIPSHQSAVERLFSDILVTLSGPQFLHCAFGLLDCNSTFSLLQAVIDDAHFRMLRWFFQQPEIADEDIEMATSQIRAVIEKPQKLYIKYVRKLLRSGRISPLYPFEGREMTDDAFWLAHQRTEELLAQPVNHIDKDVTNRLYREIPGLLQRLAGEEGGK